MATNGETMNMLRFRLFTCFVVIPTLMIASCGDDPIVDESQDGGITADATVDGTIGSADGGDPADVDDEPDVVPLNDSSEEDAVDGGVGVDTGVCSGFGCTCTDNDACDSALCVETADGKVCSKSCVDNCPEGFECASVSAGGGDVISMCVPLHVRLCEPCAVDADCNSPLSAGGARCVPYVADGVLVGNFCADACATENPCPQGYGCESAKGSDGAEGQQCIRDDGTCACSKRATKLALSTTCEAANDAGTCSGSRSCGDEGLSACDAPQAATESCNDLDDDCDGKTDETGPGVCDDGTPCTYDNCVSGKCQHPTASGDCSDGDACTESDACDNGVCKGAAKTCDDSNPCTDDSCDAKTGCTAKANSQPCDDGDVCSLKDACADSQCVPGEAKVCNDDNPCTDDACDPKSGCTTTNNTLPCDDGTLCTKADTCAKGACAGQAIACADGNPCTDDACDAKTGCTHEDNSADCSDANACTIGDSCKAGVCLPGAATVCADDNPCTTDSCDPKSGCTTANNTLPCDDGSVCTAGDVCAKGACAGAKKINCDDENPCTDDTCDADKGCGHVANKLKCTDNNVCTVGDLCGDTLCIPGPATVCDDNNPCTDDSCDPDKACQHAANSAPCTDGDACTTGDHCANSACVAKAKLGCNDENPCTDDSCDKLKGCGHVANTKPCTDNNVCTVADTCAASLCVPGAQKPCADSNPCTTDSCDAKTGCAQTPNTLPCDDGSACTLADTCKGGKCAGGAALNCNDGNPCTDDSCKGSQGCVFNNNTKKCNDNNACTTGDACKSGTCTPAAPSACDDGNVCTTESCNPKTGCTKANNSAPCSDGSVCTVADGCKGGKCVAGTKQSCNDGNPCTNDSCDANAGCKHAANTASCSDGNVCTVKDVCKAGLCLPGGAKSCADGNVCTSELCHPLKGCQVSANKAPCDDGSVCTIGDVCAAKKCIAGKKVSCDDGNPCTDDSCNAKTGCVHNFNSKPCSDGNGCTKGDVCSQGKCKIGPVGCAKTALCVAANKSPVCKCNAGYSGDGFTCTDVNECKSNNGGCHKNAICTNKPGSFSCACKPGYSGDGKACTRHAVVDPYNDSKLLDGGKTASVRVSGGVLSLQPVLHFGDGADGSIVVNGSVNIQTSILKKGRKRADGEAFAVSKLGSNTITIGGTGTGGTPSNQVQQSIAAGDEVLLINQHAPGSNSKNVGRYEFCQVTTATGSTITCLDKLTQTYGISANSNLSGQRVVVQRVPNYKDVTVGSKGVIDTRSWDGSRGGIIAFRASGTLTVQGSIRADSRGYRGAPGVKTKTKWGGGWRGESPNSGYGQYRTWQQSHGGGGGGDAEWCHSGNGAGGGGHASGGHNGYAAFHQCGGGWSFGKKTAEGGKTYGNSSLTRLYMGASGGSGGVDGDNPDSGGAGSPGGGIVMLFAGNIALSGSITARGAKGGHGNGETGGGGSGAGGSILIGGHTISLGSSKVRADGGPTGSAGRNENRGGNGGVGRVAVRYSKSVAGTSVPGFNKSKTAAWQKAGVASSVDLLAGKKGVVGLYAFNYALTSLPGGTAARIQFSPNNSTWYSAAGAKNTTTSLGNGTKSLSLAKLPWKKGPFYYRLLFNGNGAATPVVSWVELNYLVQ